MTTTSASATSPVTRTDSIFTPTEHAILSHWLGRKPPPGAPSVYALPIRPADDVGRTPGTGIQLQ